MLEEIGRVKSGQVTYAVRDTTIDDKAIREGDIMGIADKGILTVGSDIQEVVKEMLAELVDADSSLISLYYGSEVAEETAMAFAEEIEQLYPELDIDMQNGGQPIYYYLLAIE